MKKRHSLLLLATAAIVALPVTVVMAATAHIDATATFLSGITLSGTAMNFSKVDFSGTPTAVTDFVKLGTNGAATYGGVFSAGTGAAPSAGAVQVTAGSNGQVLEVRCSATATMTNGAGASIGVTGIQVNASNATAAYGSGNDCLGTGGAAATTLTLNLGVLDTFKFGGMVDGSTAAAFTGGSFSTANAGGSDIQVDVVYQ